MRRPGCVKRIKELEEEVEIFKRFTRSCVRGAALRDVRVGVGPLSPSGPTLGSRRPDRLEGADHHNQRVLPQPATIASWNRLASRVNSIGSPRAPSDSSRTARS